MDTKKKIYIHIGLHKTGTTSIQWALKFSRDYLSSENFLYPNTGTPEWAPFGQHMLPWSVLSRDHYRPSNLKKKFNEIYVSQLWNNLAEEIENSRKEKIILSSEEFDILNKSEILRIADYLKDFDVQIILFIRNKADFLESVYYTAVSYSQYSKSIDHLVNNCRSRTDFHQLILDWGDVWGFSNISIIDYDDIVMRRDSVFSFLKLLNLDPQKLSLKSLQRQNKSLPAFSIKLLQLTYINNYDTGACRLITEKIRKHTVLSNGSNYTLMSPELRNRLNNSMRAEITMMASDPKILNLLPNSLKSYKEEGKKPNKKFLGTLEESILAFLENLES